MSFHHWLTCIEHVCSGEGASYLIKPTWYLSSLDTIRVRIMIENVDVVRAVYL